MGINSVGGLNLSNHHLFFATYIAIIALCLAFIPDQLPIHWWQLMLTIILWVAFAGNVFSLDMKYLMDDSKRLVGLGFKQCLTTLPHTQYVCDHPPFYTYAYARINNYVLLQFLVMALSFLDLLMIYSLYGWRTSFLISATPLFMLMRTEPSNDFVAYSLVLLSIYASSISPVLGAAIYGVSFLIKGTPIFAMPLAVYTFGYNIVISLAIVLVFLLWARNYRFYKSMLTPIIRHVGRLRRRWSVHRLKARFNRYSDEIRSRRIDWSRPRIHWSFLYICVIFIAPTPYRIFTFCALALMRAAPKYYIMVLL